MKPKASRNAQNILPAVCGVCTILLIILIMNRDYPFIGHDYGYFIPRLIDTDLHVQLNDVSIQWYTPSFGGGLPAFPNPQHIEYSIVQVVSLFINPWVAVLVTTAGICLIGYYYFYKFLNKKLELNWMSSALGAMFFIGNGFYIEHMIVGHLGYQLFPLSAGILYLLIDAHNKTFISAIIIALMLTLIIHQAGFYLIVILILSFGITLPMLYLYRPQLINLKRITLTASLSVIFSTALTGSKVYAVVSLMRHFPREIFDTYYVGLLHAFAGIAAQLLGVMTFAPILIFTQNNTDVLFGALRYITGAKYGIWEIDTGLSPVLNAFLLVGLARLILEIRMKDRLRIDRSRMFAFALFLTAVWFTTEMILARGIIYPLIKQLPVLRSLHVNTRFASAFILPLTIVGAFQLNRFFSQNLKPLYFSLMTLFTIAFLLSYFSLSREIHSRIFDMRSSNETYEKIRHGEIFPVIHIADITDWKGISEHTSSYRPYEPLFGYGLETFTPEIHPGEILETSDGYFNMTNPASLVFPEVNNLHVFERINIGERDKLRLFIERRQPDWKIPVTQRILNMLSLIALIFSISVLFVVGIPIRGVFQNISSN